jgi:hypothetical protein
MAFAATVKGYDTSGAQRVVYGEYTQVSGDTGGDIATGLKKINYIDATGMTKVSISSGTATITTADPGADQTGYWRAWGH